MQPDTLLPVRVAPSLAVRLAADLYGIQAVARPLPGEYDDNFHLTCADGEQFVLKVMHPQRERQLLELQVEALQHIAERDRELATPRVRRGKDGQLITLARDPTGASRYVWMLEYIPGRALVEARPRVPQLLESLGKLLGELDGALADFQHPAARRELKWDSSRAAWIKEYVHHIAPGERRDQVVKLMDLYDREVIPVLPRLRHSVIHGDANDHNVITAAARGELPRALSVIDFGDMHYGITVSEVAIAAAYALLGESDPLAAIAAVVAGYHRAFPLHENEIAVIWPLVAARLCVSVVNSAHRKTLSPDEPYITISEQPAWAALERLARIPPRLAHYTLRAACGLSAVPASHVVVRWLESQRDSFMPIVAGLSQAHVLDLSVGSLMTGADPQCLEEKSLTRLIQEELHNSGAQVAVGRYGEARALYTAPAFCATQNPTQERRTIHLGVDLFAEAGTAIHAPLSGTVHAIANNANAQDYGPVVILRHETAAGAAFFTLYGHLSAECLRALAPGQPIAAGQPFAAIGTREINGHWTPHLHFQIILDLLDLNTDFPGVARASQRDVWLALSPDPSLIARLPTDAHLEPLEEKETLRRRRRARLGRNLSISYQHPLEIVRGWRQYLYDETGRAYLDVYNNVPLVGHSHPKVVTAVQRQIRLLNTNTRYLHDNVVRYAERLTELLPEPLQVCYFLNSASEANELALRLARAYTSRYDVIVLEHAYHGHTNGLIDISPYKFDGPGGTGRKPWVHVAPIADDYRGPHRRNEPDRGRKYAAHVADLIATGVRPAAFIAESLPSVGGQIVFPDGYLPAVYQHVRAAGGVCIADEVQVGFGRLGTHFWGFSSQHAVPDIVVFGKPIGNAFPLAAVVTTAPIAAAFDNGMEFFSTFGGNPVACAAGLAVLDVLEEERLPENARRVGDYLLDRLNGLKTAHQLVGDVRGMGLFLGVELVKDRNTLEPAAAEASYAVNRLRDHGILTGVDGPYHNVIKIRPPLCFSERDADLFVDTLAGILAEDGLQLSH